MAGREMDFECGRCCPYDQIVRQAAYDYIENRELEEARLCESPYKRQWRLGRTQREYSVIPRRDADTLEIAAAVSPETAGRLIDQYLATQTWDDPSSRSILLDIYLTVFPPIANISQVSTHWLRERVKEAFVRRSLIACPAVGTFGVLLPFAGPYIRQVPAESGVYVIYRDGLPFYVGRSRINIHERLWRHLTNRGSKRISMEAKVRLQFEYECMDSPEQAESTLIAKLQTCGLGNLRVESDPAEMPGLFHAAAHFFHVGRHAQALKMLEEYEVPSYIRSRLFAWVQRIDSSRI